MNKKMILNYTDEGILAHLISFGFVRGTKILDSFACWFLAGCAAALVLMFANLDSLIKYYAISDIQIAIKLFVGAVAFCTIQKYLSVTILSSIESSEEVYKKIAKIKPEDQKNLTTFDFEKFYKEFERPFLFIQRGVLRYFFRKIKEGDLNVTSRFFIHCFQAQRLLVFIQMILLVCFIFYLIPKMPV